MDTWLTRIGVISTIVSILLLTPLADLLPIGLWSEILDLFCSDENHIYHKLVPTEEYYLDTFVFMFLGFTAIIVGKYLKLKKNKSI